MNVHTKAELLRWSKEMLADRLVKVEELLAQWVHAEITYEGACTALAEFDEAEYEDAKAMGMLPDDDEEHEPHTRN